MKILWIGFNISTMHLAVSCCFGSF
ncbi:hypothetical protein OIU77_020189 [Salix suchowensis]|uniref:Uncharacterized protein n=1 Tax=Salix suchowensis TaxID=1278906 RepID=A0ABQ9CL47_9ROSI|nr:hypothetical protein OIU78_021639 [Salix suchowensis]KAJ6399584.1 hypothetical protein OIU77_020189 [Salix suchowensis]